MGNAMKQKFKLNGPKLSKFSQIWSKILKKVGFSAVPNDAVIQVKKIADYRCKASGGKGCFREIADLILLSKFSYKA